MLSSPQELLSILISIARGIRDKATKLKIVDEKTGEILPGKEDEYAGLVNSELENELPRMIDKNGHINHDYPGLSLDDINENWQNARPEEQEIAEVAFDDINSTQEIEMERSVLQENSVGNDEISMAASLLSGLTRAENTSNTRRSFQESEYDADRSQNSSSVSTRI